MELVIVTGLSGAGKSQAMDCMEDLGYYCIDNMPPALIKNFLSLEAQKKINIEKAVFVVDIRGGEFFGELMNVLNEIKEEGKQYKIIYLEASDSVLIRRFKETRRNHPLKGDGTNLQAIRKEREFLKEIRSQADLIFDTSDKKTAQLHQELRRIFVPEEKKGLFEITIMSFGYKHGMPQEADTILDVRFLPNPYYLASMRNLTGNSKKVQEYILRAPIAQVFIDRMNVMIHELVPFYAKEGKTHLVIAFGCTGGQHRSVAMANIFSKLFAEQDYKVSRVHRDIYKR